MLCALIMALRRDHPTDSSVGRLPVALDSRKTGDLRPSKRPSTPASLQSASRQLGALEVQWVSHAHAGKDYPEKGKAESCVTETVTERVKSRAEQSVRGRGRGERAREICIKSATIATHNIRSSWEENSVP